MSSVPAEEVSPQPLAPAAAPGEGNRFALEEGVSLRARAARGTIVNGVFLAALNGLGMLRGVIVAGILGVEVFGVWGLLTATFGTLLWLAQIGVDDKYIQQDHPDQRAAFEIAFTLQCLLCGAFVVLVMVAVPLFALLYGRQEILLPGLVLGLAMPALALQTPLWVFYRRLDFARQRTLQVFDPIVALVVSVGLALAGLGVWALVLGVLCGSWVTAVLAIRASPYRLAFRYERGSLRQYASFSWPLFLSSASGVLAGQIPVVVAGRTLGLAAVGALALASGISQVANRVDDIVTQTLYPAICAVKDRGDLLFESFSKSNRLALLWAVPCGVGTALFAPDLVPRVLGSEWAPAVVLVQWFGLAAAWNQIGFNWTAFFRARAETRPIAVANALMLVAVLAFAVPLLVTRGLAGFGLGMGVATGCSVAVRLYYLSRIFPAFRMVGHVVRALLPVVPGTVAVLAGREVEPATRGLPVVLGEAVAFVAITALASWLLERRLLGEAVGYLRRRASAPAPAAAA